MDGQTYKRKMKKLTSMETKVLQLRAQGYTRKEIAEKVFRSPSTISNHLISIYKKLEARNSAHAVVKALHYNLITYKEE